MKGNKVLDRESNDKLGKGTWFQGDLVASVGSLLGTLFCPLIYVPMFVPAPQCFGYCSFVEQLEIRQCDISSFVLHFKIVLATWGLLCFHIDVRIICSNSVKNVIDILIEVALNMQIILGSIVILTFTLPIHNHDMSSSILCHLQFFSLIKFFILYWGVDS